MWLSAAVAVLTIGTTLQPALAQVGPLPRPRGTEDLLRSLIEAELARRGEEFKPGPQALPPRPDDPRLTGPQGAGIDAVRRLMGDYATEASRLAADLNNELDRFPAIRLTMTDVLKVRARAALLAQDSLRASDPQQIAPSFAELDRLWRGVSFKLGQLRGVNPAILQSLTRLDAVNQRVGEAIQIRPQLDTVELMRQTAALAADLGNLLDDIQMELAQAPEKPQLLLDGRRLEQQARQVTATAYHRPEYDAIAREYAQFRNQWQPYAARLLRYESRYLERSLRRIAAADQAINQILWLPQELDRSQVAILSTKLRANIDDFFRRTTLRLLVSLPGGNYLPVSDAFYGSVENFASEVESGENAGSMLDAFGYVEGAWREFDALFRQIESPAAQQLLAEIGQTVDALRVAMRVSSGFDNRATVESAAALDNLADQLERSVGFWLSSTPTPFRNEALRETAAFHAAARRFHAAVDGGRRPQELRDEVNALFESWLRTHDYVGRCTSREREQILGIASRITPLLVDLQTHVSY
jgi:hypothetical protein